MGVVVWAPSVSNSLQKQTPSFDHLLIPEEGQDLHSSIGLMPEDEPHLFVSLPKVVWVHIYGLLDVPTLFRAQRVCLRWRNLVNQPICWHSRAQELAEWNAKVHADRVKDASSRDWSEDEGTASTTDDEVTVFGGPASVAALKRQCKTLFVKQAVLMQHYDPRSAAVADLLANAAAVADEDKQALWNEAWALEPCAKVAFERGRYFENLEQYEEAVVHYTQAVTQCPWDHAVRTRLGLTYHKWGKLEEALQNYLKTAALAPHYQLAWNNAGSIFFNTGFFERAKTCFSRCVMLDKRAGVAYNNRGLCHFLAGDGASAGKRGEEESAINCYFVVLTHSVADFTTAFHLNQGDKTARSNRAAALNLIGDYAAAIQDCVAELSRGQVPELVGTPYLNCHLGYAHMKTGDLDAAIAALRVAIEAKPDYRRAYDLLAQCLLEKGEAGEAREIALLGEPCPLKCGGNESIFMYFLY